MAGHFRRDRRGSGFAAVDPPICAEALAAMKGERCVMATRFHSDSHPFYRLK